MNLQNQNKALYFGISVLTAYVTDPTVQMIFNEPALLHTVGVFAWQYLGCKCLLAGLIAVKAFNSNPAVANVVIPVTPVVPELPKP